MIYIVQISTSNKSLIKTHLPLNIPLGSFLWRMAPQQKLRTHRSLKVYCATLWWRWRKRWSVFSFFQVMEHRWNEIDRGKPKYSEKNLSQCNFVYHKSHMGWPGICFSFPFYPLIHFVPLNPSLLLHVTYIPYYCPYTSNTTQTSMPPAGFEPTVPASERPQTYALDRAASGLCNNNSIQFNSMGIY